MKRKSGSKGGGEKGEVVGGEDEKKQGQAVVANITKSGRVSIPVLDHWRSEHASTKDGKLVIHGGESHLCWWM